MQIIGAAGQLHQLKSAKGERDDNTFPRLLQFPCRWESSRSRRGFSLQNERCRPFRTRARSSDPRKISKPAKSAAIKANVAGSRAGASLNFSRPPVLQSSARFLSPPDLRAAPRGAQTLINSFLYLDYRDQWQKGERTLASGSTDESNRASRNSRTDLPSLRARALFATRIPIHRSARAASAE